MSVDKKIREVLRKTKEPGGIYLTTFRCCHLRVTIIDGRKYCVDCGQEV